MRRGWRASWEKKENLPTELRGSRLWASEKSFHIRRPIPLTGRVDQVYRINRNTLVVIDTKSRSKAVVYESDRAQISEYAMMIRHRPWGWLSGLQVAKHGYVRLVTHEGVYYRKIDLLSEKELIGLYRRYLDVMSGRRPPEFAENERLCFGCPQRGKCPRMIDRGVVAEKA
ncbi:MAG: PD-(D/E)XK nuclease family protein [Sulfuricaulis sp.]